MKLTKKLLTILPMATIGCVTPFVISGCSCGNSYTINYGDTINCKNKDGKDYHSIDQVKEAANSHKQVFDEQSMTQEQLIKWDSTNKTQQFFYWDLVYSVAVKNVPFVLTWTFTDTTKTSLKEGKYNDISFESLSYAFNDNGKVEIRANGLAVESYAYHLVARA